MPRAFSLKNAAVLLNARGQKTISRWKIHAPELLNT